MATSEETAVIMSALMKLPPSSFPALLRSLSSDLRLRRRRLSFLLLSPPHFAAALSHLRSLSLHHKALLLARLLLRSLALLLPLLSYTPSLRLRDYDAALLLLAMCDSYDVDACGSPSVPDWRARIASHVARRALSVSGLGCYGVVGPYVDAAAKCRRLVDAVSPAGRRSGARPASAGAVAALPLVERRVGCCAVCREEEEEEKAEAGREVCELPCGHAFHWGCILRWLGRRNTCPCCRFELPTDDVLCEIERLWREAATMGGAAYHHQLVGVAGTIIGPHCCYSYQ